MIQLIAVIIVLFVLLLYQIVVGVYDVNGWDYSRTYGGAAKPKSKWYAVQDVNDRAVVSPLEYHYVRSALHRSKAQPHTWKQEYGDLKGATENPMLVPEGSMMVHAELYKWKGNEVAMVRWVKDTCVYGRILMRSQSHLDLLMREYIQGYVSQETRRSIRSAIQPLCPTLKWDNPNEIIEYSRVVTFDLGKTVRLPKWVYIAPKLGGEMCYVYFDTDGYPFHLRDTLVKTVPRARAKQYGQSLWVAELVDQTYWVVDLLLDKGHAVVDDEFEKRWARVPAQGDLPPGFRQQQYVKTGWEDRRSGILGWHDGLQAVDALISELNTDNVPTDGIIIQPPRVPYYTLQVQKWKPPHEQTVDALLDGTDAWLHNRGELVKHQAVPYTLTEPLSIGECLVKDRRLKPTGKLRPDKYRPNSEAALRYPEFLSRRDVLEGRTGHLMKVYNRSSQDWTIWPTVKKRSTILDIGAGKGRSQDWWKRLVLKVYAVEPDRQNYKVLVDRARPYRSAPIGGEDPELQKLVPQSEIDTVVMSFSISFFFKDQSTMQKLLDNICWALKPGGTLIGLGIDGDRVLEALRENGDNIDSEAFSIRSITRTAKPTTYGCKILIDMKHEGSLVKDQEEYLVNWDEWVRVLGERGIELVRTEFLQGHWCLAQWPLWFTRSSRWWVFQRKS